ncbi:hypothetical protein EB796_019689 [Bugula neritina]|uniref:Uncharacterized protein n=1 Tax=Bugula neritina TaxID=10212 RepID=A0A7J7J6Z7_BUGNE|nr:hypothetical protein EB796_019689 [Bugula neritina]
MVDSQVTVLEVFKNQGFISETVENIITRQEDIDRNVSNMATQVNQLGKKLDELCRVMANRKERRDSRRADPVSGAGGSGGPRQDDLLGDGY